MSKTGRKIKDGNKPDKKRSKSDRRNCIGAIVASKGAHTKRAERNTTPGPRKHSVTVSK